MISILSLLIGVSSTPLLDDWHPRDATARRDLAAQTYARAFEVSGHLAWRYVTMAQAIDPLHRASLEQIVSHYSATEGGALALRALERAEAASRARGGDATLLDRFVSDKLQRVRAKLKEEDTTVAAAAVTIEGGAAIVHSPFATPVLRLSLASAAEFRVAPSSAFTAFNAALSAVALSEYSATLATVNVGTESSGVNNAFYERQMETQRRTGRPLPSVDALPAWHRLEVAARGAFQRYLCDAIGATPTAARAIVSPPQRVVSWLSVLASGGSSERHIHGDQTLVAAYYARVPHGGGPLVFEDPRGNPIESILAWRGGGAKGAAPPSPPFVRSFAIAPSQGEFVVFPGFLAHRVERGTWPPADGVRIAVVFGLLGEWDVVGSAAAATRSADDQRNETSSYDDALVAKESAVEDGVLVRLRGGDCAVLALLFAIWTLTLTLRGPRCFRKANKVKEK